MSINRKGALSGIIAARDAARDEARRRDLQAKGLITIRPDGRTEPNHNMLGIPLAPVPKKWRRGIEQGTFWSL